MKKKIVIIWIWIAIFMLPNHGFSAVELIQYFTAAQQLADQTLPTPAGRLEELELYWLALTLDALHESGMSLQYLQYLKEYYPKSPLQKILPKIPVDIPYLPHFDLDPEISRLIKTIFQEIKQGRYTVNTPAFTESIALLTMEIEALLQGNAETGWEQFLEKYPDSEYSGWAAYQLAWKARHRASGDSDALQTFWANNKNHPLGQEATEAMDVQFFSPERLSFLSAVVPGLGEETLEPGMHESSSVMYSELLFLAGTIGFAIAAQNNARVENLTGALIIGNFLILNHKGSADKTYMLAHRRNMAEQRNFQNERIDQSVLGPGKVIYIPNNDTHISVLGDDLVFSLAYQTRSIASNLRGQGYVQDNDLINLGFRVEYLANFITFPIGSNVDLGISAIPFGRMVLNAAEKYPDANLDEGLYLQEYSAGAELACLTRWSFTETFLQLRASAGPAFRLRSLTLDRHEFQDETWVPSITLGLDWGGLSGSYWHFAVFYESGISESALQMDTEKINLSSQSLGYIFGLGIHF